MKKKKVVETFPYTGLYGHQRFENKCRNCYWVAYKTLYGLKKTMKWECERCEREELLTTEDISVYEESAKEAAEERAKPISEAEVRLAERNLVHMLLRLTWECENREVLGLEELKNYVSLLPAPKGKLSKAKKARYDEILTELFPKADDLELAQARKKLAPVLDVWIDLGLD